MIKPMYVLDANVFIEAKRRYYAFDIVPSFWNALEAKGQSGEILSIDRVRQELERGKDDLATWISSNWQYFHSTASQPVLAEYAKLMVWAQGQGQYTQAAQNEFARAEAADAWLLAFCISNGLTLVTHEEFSADAKKRILLPNVCRAFSINYCNTFEMLRNLGVKF
jgi:predicted nucleic acid-binding protein